MAGDDDTKTQKIDHTSPYYLGSGDGPGIVISTVIFRGDNYEEWSRSIRLSLMSRRKFEFIDGSIKKPTDKYRLLDWRCVQATLVQWILNTIDASVKKTVPYFEEAKLLWDVLKERFSIGNGPRIQQIKAALADCRQPKNMSVVDYFGKLQILWDELGSYEPIIACTCGGCSCGKCTCGGCKCDFSKVMQKRMDVERFHQFLYGINDELYGNVRSNLLSQDPLPTLDRAYQTLLQEEKVRNSSRAKSECDDVLTLAVKSDGNKFDRFRYDGKDKSNLVCSFCNRTGHQVNNCFSKNGYPDWWGDRSRSTGRVIGRGRGGGLPPSQQQTATTFAGRGRGGAEVQAVGASSLNEGAYSASVGAEPAAVPGMTAVQWQQVLDMFGNIKTSSDDRLSGESINNCWILDTGPQTMLLET